MEVGKDMEKVIEIHDLIKTYGSDFQLGSLDFELEKGTILGLIGENGAGKTTLIKSILNAIHMDSGSIKIFGKDYQKYESEIKEDIGIVLDKTFFNDEMTAKKINIVMKDVYKNWDSQLYSKYLKDFSIPIHKRVGKLSTGMKKKLEIAVALSHHPKLLILDEPTNGLDPIVRNDVLSIFLDFIEEKDHSILFSTHITSDLERIADRIVFINHGKKEIDMTLDDIMNTYGILKCGFDSFQQIDSEDILFYQKNRYDYWILVKDKNRIIEKYPDYRVDKITLEDLMILIIRGESK